MREQWTTLLDPEITAPYGFIGHAAWFAPRKWPPPERNVITLLIPECETQFKFPENNGAILINRPQANKNVKYWLRSACKDARSRNAVVIFACDTAEQAERAAKMAAKLLPNHERTALERIYEEKTRSGAGLN
jgi:hypothetical protein